MTVRTGIAVLFFVIVFGAETQGQAQTIQYFPQIADGGGYVTTWYFAGLGDGPASVTIDLFSPTGAPLALATNRGTASSFNFSVASAGELSVRTSGLGSAVNVGWARVTSSPAIGVTEVFQVYSNGQVVSQAGVLASEPTAASTLFVTVDGRGRNAGLAIINVGSSANPLTFTVYDQSGNSIATSHLTLAPQNQIAKFITELDDLQSIGPMEGSLSISGTSRFSVVTLVLDGGELSTLPVLPGRLTHTTSTVDVPGITSLELAGMPIGCSVGNTSVPLNSPVEAGLGLVAGKSITVVATGTVTAGNLSTGPAGSPPNGSVGAPNSTCAGVPFAIANMTGRAYALVGVFLGPSASALPRPPALDFLGGATETVRLQPLLQQPFYIGSGKTMSGESRQFVIPDGATRLYLGSLGGTVGSPGNSDNSGSFTATLSINP